jgi:hypothetical protein
MQHALIFMLSVLLQSDLLSILKLLQIAAFGGLTLANCGFCRRELILYKAQYQHSLSVHSQ